MKRQLTDCSDSLSDDYELSQLSIQDSPEKENSKQKKLVSLGKSLKLGKPLKLSTLKPIRFHTDTSLLKKPFKIPSFVNGTRPALLGGVKAGIHLGMRRSVQIMGPLHDPELPDAIVLYHPKVTLTAGQKLLNFKKEIKDVQEVHVVIDPLLAKVLRPHQIEGVRFLYECVTGQKQEGAFGYLFSLLIGALWRMKWD